MGGEGSSAKTITAIEGGFSCRGHRVLPRSPSFLATRSGGCQGLLRASLDWRELPHPISGPFLRAILNSGTCHQGGTEAQLLVKAIWIELLIRMAKALWQLSLCLGDLSSGLPVAGLSHLSACSCLISDFPLRLDGVGSHGVWLTCWSLPFQLNSIFSKSRQLRYILPWTFPSTTERHRSIPNLLQWMSGTTAQGVFLLS